MDITNIIDKLNSAQREAVTAPPTSMLILAGAGSGKTRVLVHRIAWLMRVEQVYPSSILAVTFTNKASKEMRGRIEDLLGRPFPIGGMWAGTFHGLAHRFLRRHHQDVGLAVTFQIMDSDDQLRLVKRIVKELNLDDKKWPPRQIQWYINAQKDEGRRARHLPEASDPFERQMQRVYLMYEQQCDKSSLVDFAELLLRTFEFLSDSPEHRDHYRRRFRHVLVDEFQDTNSIQYSWLSLLTNDRDNLFVVGDDDQSIYSWRGAKIENIFKFQEDNPNHQIVRLEQNYRSTGHILSAANALIANNEGRLGKNLWTEEGLGDHIFVYSAFNEQDEAYFVVDRIRQWSLEGNKRTDSAILYRSNAQSRQFEEKLIAMGIPYRIYGGLRFFERQEIKDALAYLRLLSNRDDPISFERIINTPTRGIGAKSLEAIRELARSEDCSLWMAAHAIVRSNAFTARVKGLLASFLSLIDGLSEQVKDKPLNEQVKIVVEKSGLIEFYQQEKGDKGEARVENLEELVTAAKQFEYEAPQQEEGENLSLLDFFLAHAALEAGETQGDASEDCVQLMTLHSAKGLEFDLVFVVGLEEGLFPSLQSLEEAGRLEEERRLCYVGITRAKQQLYLTHAESRRIYGKESYPRASRFLREIPPEHIHEIRMKANITRPVSAKEAPFSSSLSSGKAGGFRLGQRVSHAKFGEGVILHAEGEGAQARVQVNFIEAGSKWLVLDVANLKAV